MFSHMLVEKRLLSLDLVNMGGGGSEGDKVLIGGLMRGDIDIMGGPNFDRLYHKLKVLLCY